MFTKLEFSYAPVVAFLGGIIIIIIFIGVVYAWKRNYVNRE
jgi:NADH:ubiquinone oxidoreductase subunit 3 (subunit A)